MSENELFSKKVIEELEKFGQIAFVPTGESMWPTLKHKRQSVLVRKKTERLTPFSIGLYIRTDDKVVLHRVIETVDGGYVFCGDSQFYTESVKEEQVVGVVDGFYKGKKYIPFTQKEIEKGKRLFANPKRRQRRVSAHLFFKKWKIRFIKLFKLEYFKVKKNV